jgi:hypothetical protein
MPSIVTASQLRTVLGVSVPLYSNDYLNEVINTAEAVILPMLVANVSAINAYELKDDVAKYYTEREHYFVAGQVVLVAGLPAPFTGQGQGNQSALSVTVLEAGQFYFTGALVNADVSRRAIIPTGTATLTGYSAAQIYAGNDAIESAILAVSVEVFQSRVAAGGQIEGLDFTATPYRMGRSLTNRVSTLLMPFLDVETVCQ